MDIYGRIKLLARLRKMKVKQIAEEAKISINTVKKWGQGTEASVSSLLMIALALDVSMDFLTGITNDPNSHKSDPKRKIEMWEEIQTYTQQQIARAKEDLLLCDSLKEDNNQIQENDEDE